MKNYTLKSIISVLALSLSMPDHSAAMELPHEVGEPLVSQLPLDILEAINVLKTSNEFSTIVDNIETMSQTAALEKLMAFWGDKPIEWREGLNNKIFKAFSETIIFLEYRVFSNLHNKDDIQKPGSSEQNSILPYFFLRAKKSHVAVTSLFCSKWVKK
ncbi:MAG: hypothetical protein LBD81_02510 [Holosporaceae bacterium]|jgi:hypothetical protein|nr:hypothetical protein [Holosporaceae bacterium]